MRGLMFVRSWCMVLFLDQEVVAPSDLADL